MELNPEVCYRAVLARDQRHDGRFFTCVKTTQIYCRPVCPARPPEVGKLHVRPLGGGSPGSGISTLSALSSRERPEFWTADATASVKQALRWIDEGALDADNVAALAERLGIGQRQLRRLFQQQLGASPIAVAQTRRILLALQLLRQTDLSMIDVALASGFQSVRRFNEAFQSLYDRPPAQLRRQQRTGVPPTSQLSLLLPYRPPYDWDALLDFFAQRAIPGLEHVADGTYARTIELDGAVGTLQATNAPEESSLRVTIEFPKLKSLPQIIARVRRMFDLSVDIDAVTTAVAQDPTMAPLTSARPGLRIPGAWDSFEIAVRAILGQQITVQAARNLASKLVAQLGAPLESGSLPSLTHRFPAASDICHADVERLGMPKARAAAIVNLAACITNDPQLFENIGRQPDPIAALCDLPGIGPWTAHYIAMRVLRDSDAFLAADVGLQRAMAVNGVRPTAQQLLQQAEKWRPWRAYAVMHLWSSETSAPRKGISHATVH